ncbi:MAG: transcriptional repressor [Alphaproteobacteria bacterium]|nr:transcriptional repressor [Alphaproteobacteria bacterium]
MTDNFLEELCKKGNIRVTSQRKIIASVLLKAKEHLDVEEIHKRAKAIDSNVSIATVYRTMKLFEDNAIVTAHNFSEDRTYYEIVSKEHHDHLINIENGEIIEFHNKQIEELQKRIAEKHGYKLIGHKLELYCIPKSTNHN